MLIGRTDTEAETPILWPPHVKSWLIGKDPDAGRDWGQEEKGMTEDEMAGWHHRLDGHEFGWTTGVGDGQGGLACCDSWGRKESDTNERLNWTELKAHGPQNFLWLLHPHGGGIGGKGNFAFVKKLSKYRAKWRSKLKDLDLMDTNFHINLI